VEQVEVVQEHQEHQVWQQQELLTLEEVVVEVDQLQV
jgi:hypothetical protein